MEGNIFTHLIWVDSSLLLVAAFESIIEMIDHIPLRLESFLQLPLEHLLMSLYQFLISHIDFWRFLSALQTSRDNGEILKDLTSSLIQRTANWIPNHWLAEFSQWQRQVLLCLPRKPCKSQSLFIWVSDFMRPKTAMLGTS